jgi:predicted transcriptional regulator
MKLPCEILVEKLPVIRAMITHEMIETFGLSQKEAAEKLGITQPAVSQYLAGMRGKKKPDKKLQAEARRLAKNIIEGKKEFPKSICSLCGCYR